ncbi:MAG: hypothetical protein FWF84_01030, partial [Kiritimatiellaeota bacterium]|nr:hypothetical protein [Kiritimatiellota bacterium]
SMPQMVAAVRRAQRRLHLVEAIRNAKMAHAPGGSLTLDRARRGIALACEHTYSSHDSSGDMTGNPDALRQHTQIASEAYAAESVSMALLRDHLAAIADPLPKEPVSVLTVNPTHFPTLTDYRSGQKGFLAFATSRHPEHLYQFDREPTVEALEKEATYGILDIDTSPRSVRVTPLATLTPPTWKDLPLDKIAYEHSPFDVARTHLGGKIPFLAKRAFDCIEERPNGAFMAAATPEMDPCDSEWNPDLTFTRTIATGKVVSLRRCAEPYKTRVEITYEGSPLRRIIFERDTRYLNRLGVSAHWRFDCDPTLRAYYLALPIAMPCEHGCDYWIDSCGSWFRAEHGQLPNTCNSFYQAHSGVAVSTRKDTLYIMGADTTLYQCGGLTFGQPPSVALQRQKPFIAVWVYNNYWGTNFPSYSPGDLETRFILELRGDDFRADIAEKIDNTFSLPYLTHPIA